MTTPKHTPGPWKLGHQQQHDTGLEILSNGLRVGVVYGDTDTECLANGQLFAAAPELAECLRELLSTLRDVHASFLYQEKKERAAALLERLGM